MPLFVTNLPGPEWAQWGWRGICPKNAQESEPVTGKSSLTWECLE